MIIVGYEKKYTKLSKYATSLIEDEIHTCKRFEDELWEEIQTLITANSELREFAKLVEIGKRVGNGLTENRNEREALKNVCSSSANTLSMSSDKSKICTKSGKHRKL